MKWSSIKPHLLPLIYEIEVYKKLFRFNKQN